MTIALPPISCKVPTPPDLASAMVKALGDKPGAKWLEPSHGDGVFLRALSNAPVSPERIVAIDLEPQPSESDILANTFRATDFLSWASATDLQFDYIVGNPPYVSIKRLEPSLRRTASQVLDIDGNPIGTGSNMWYGFVVSAIRLLSKGGSLAFVLPSAAEFAHYTTELRSALKDSFESLEIYRCKRSLFENVQEGTVVAIARGYGYQPFRYRRREFEDKASLINALSSNKKFRGKSCPTNCSSEGFAVTRLDSIAKIRLGGVTGDASYFLMNDKRRKELRLPVSAMTPVVSKAKQIRSATIDKEQWSKLKDSGERIWLFNPKENQTKEESVSDYLELDLDDGGCNREAFKVSNRDPWYRISLPETADAFISGMSQSGPWLTINKMPRLSATNTLYVVAFNDRDSDVWYKWALAMLTSVAQKQIQRIGRRYADGLIKYEPGPLGKIVLPEMEEHSDFKTLYDSAVKSLLSSKLAAAKKIADSAIRTS